MVRTGLGVPAQAKLQAKGKQQLFTKVVQSKDSQDSPALAKLQGKEDQQLFTKQCRASGDPNRLGSPCTDRLQGTERDSHTLHC